MTFDAGLAILHHLAIIALIMLLAAELALLLAGARRPESHQVELLGKLDLAYGLAAAAVLVAGGLRIWLGAKPAAFYFESPVFWGKMAAFLVVGLISVIPTLRFIRWRKALRADQAALPSSADYASMRRLAWLQVGLIPIVAAFAALMARGIGLS